MRLMIKQRVFSWGDTYDIYDEMGNVKYEVRAEIFAFGHQMHVYDTQGNEIGKVSQRLLTLMPQFDIEMSGQVRGTISKQFTFFMPRYDIDFNGWRVEGDFLGWDYDVYSGCSKIIHITKEPFHWGDTYVIDIANPEDELMGLMLVVAIDAANCSNND
ncbi:MAG: hypothetical protein IJ379_06140 [Lachnospiraceae bacterium]|nr:hypothetical protein [Lachnospiraceae bacterium]